jgi:hypothetical protein
MMRYFELADEEKMKSSLVLFNYLAQLHDIEDSGLSNFEIMKKEKLIKLVQLIGEMKIIDAKVLGRIFDMYKYKQPRSDSFTHSN